jgi:hypothetical protein
MEGVGLNQGSDLSNIKIPVVEYQDWGWGGRCVY